MSQLVPIGFPVHNERAVAWLDDLDPEMRSDLVQITREIRDGFILKEVQWLQIIRQIDIFFKDAIAVETSQTGAGKTFMALVIAKLWQQLAARKGLVFRLIIVYSKNAASSWSEWFYRTGIYPNFECSYEALASYRGLTQKKNGAFSIGKPNDPWVICNHGYLAGRLSHKRQNYTCFAPTSTWLNAGIKDCNFIIIDEVQKCKNETNNNHAVSALLSVLTQTPIPDAEQHNYKLSRALLMSATPYDSEDNIVPWFRMFGAISEESLVEGVPKNPTQVGLDQIISYCRRLDPEQTEIILSEYEDEIRPGGRYREALFELFRDLVVIKFFRGTAAEIDPSLYSGVTSFKSPKKYENGKLCLDSETLEEMRKVLERLKEVVVGKERQDGSRFSRNMGEYTRIYRQLQDLKLPFMIEEGRKWLENQRGSKLVLVVNYLDHVAKLNEVFAMYRPLIITGEVKDKSVRRELERKFQEPNLDSRVFIFTAGAGSVSISLHDVYGNFPRQLIMLPSFNTIDMLQAAGRIVRTGLKSKALVRIIYVNDRNSDLQKNMVTDSDNPEIKGSCLEKRLLEKITKRSETVRTALINNDIEGSIGKGILFFDRYKIEVEAVPNCSGS